MIPLGVTFMFASGVGNSALELWFGAVIMLPFSMFEILQPNDTRDEILMNSLHVQPRKGVNDRIQRDAITYKFGG